MLLWRFQIWIERKQISLFDVFEPDKGVHTFVIMALTLKGSNVCTNIGSFCEILNYSQGDTINHCLVLLEGEINTHFENSSTRLEEETLKPKNRICINENVPDKTICSTEQQELSNSEEHEILVHHKQSCQTWPIIGGKFKALVNLDKGVNKLEFECPWLHGRQDLILTYEKLQNQPRYCIKRG